MATLIGEAASHVTTRTRRRALVAGFYLTLVSAAAVNLLAARGDGLDVAGGILNLAAMLELVLLLHITHHSRTNPPALLDERERAERDQAYRRAYRILSWGVAALVLYAWVHLRWGWGWTPATPRDWVWTWYPGALTMAALPSAVIAWNGLDLPAEDPEDAEAERAALRGVPLSSVRLRVIGALAVVCLALSAAQYAGFGPLPSRYGSGVFAGTACGLLFGMALLWNWERRRKSP